MKLVLKPIPQADYPAYHAMVNVYDVARMTATIPYPCDLEYVTQRLDERRELEASNGSMIERGISDEEGVLVGNAGHFPHDSGGREIGYFVGPEYWGKGYASAAAVLLVKLMREQGYTGKIYATVVKGNPASVRVLEKLGFAQVGEGQGVCMARPGELLEHLKFELPAVAKVVTIRPLVEEDFDTLAEFHSDVEAAFQAGASPDPADLEGHKDRFQRLLDSRHKGVLVYTVLHDENIAGYIATFIRGEHREVSYWIGRDYWGLNVASCALGAFIPVVRDEFPGEYLHGRVVDGNEPSLRILEKHGFLPIGRESFFSDIREAQVEETILKLG